MFETRGVIFVKSDVESVKTALKKHFFILGYILKENAAVVEDKYKDDLIEFFINSENQWVNLIPEDISKVYHYGIAISKELPDTPVISFRKEYDDSLNFKIYLNGKPVFKYGKSDDYEVSYMIPENNEAALEEFLKFIKVNPVIASKVIEKLKTNDRGFANYFITSLNIVFALPKFSELSTLTHEYLLFVKAY